MAEIKSPELEFNFDRLTFSDVARFSDNTKLAFLNAVTSVIAPNIDLNGKINLDKIRASQASALRFYGLFFQEVYYNQVIYAQKVSKNQ